MKKRERAGCDKLILARIVAGSLVINTKTGCVISRGKELVPFCDRRGYRFVRICHKGRRKAIGVHRIVWMAAHQRMIPKGYEVHHRDRHRWNCRIDNLQCMTHAQHYFETYGRWPKSEKEAYEEYMRS